MLSRCCLSVCCFGSAQILSNPAAVQYVSELSSYVSSRGFDASLIPSLVVHGVVHPYAGEAREDFRSFLMEIIYLEQRKAGLRVFTNVFKDRMDFAAYWDSRSNVYDRLSTHILVPAAERKFVPALLPTRPPSDPQPKSDRALPQQLTAYCLIRLHAAELTLLSAGLCPVCQVGVPDVC